MVALVLACIVLGSGWLVLSQRQAQLEQAHITLEHLYEAVAERAKQAKSQTHYEGQTWSSDETADVIAQSMHRYSTGTGVNLSSLQVHRRKSTPRELGQVRYTLSAQGSYPAIKGWLGELLERYPSLALENMTMTSTATDASQQEAQLTLVVFLMPQGPL